jgi:hypothetical protein
MSASSRGELLMKVLAGFIATLVVLWGLFWVLPSLRIETSNQNVSGIVYNVKNDGFISGNTTFSVRAAVDTVVTAENESSYCLPGNSPYKALVNEAAENKEIKLVIKTEKMFYVESAPWACADNVTVTRVK